MTSTGWVLLGVGVLLVLLLAWSAFTLTRLRRLEGRVRRAWDVLAAALVRRAELSAAVVRERAAELGPELADALRAAVEQAHRPADGDREGAENALGRVVREVPATVRAADLDDAGWRVGLARRFYNDAVRDNHSLRRRPMVATLGLHGRRPLPRFFDIDDGLDAVITGTGPGNRV